MKHSSTKISLILLLTATLGLWGCQTTNERTGKGAAAGAAVGGIVGAGKGGAKGAAIGAAAGAAAGAAIGAYLDKRAKELAEVVPTKKTEKGLLVTLQNDLLFDFDEATLRDGAKDTLSELADILAKYPDDELRLAGYTDHIGPTAYNQQLSEERAESVRQFLAAQGIKKRRIAAVGMGEYGPDAETEEGRQQHRKVEIYIQPDLPEEEQASN